MKDYEEKLNIIIKSIDSLEEIDLSDIPKIELYMDQVTTFIDDKLKSYKRYSDDKILTKTMINNYTKDKLLPPSNRKKYSKNHMILLILIYHLKSILSINDIRTLFNSINIIPENDGEKNDIEKIYSDFIEFQENQPKIDISQINLKQSVSNNDRTSLVSAVIMLVIQAETQKMLAEKIIDTFFIADTSKKK